MNDSQPLFPKESSDAIFRPDVVCRDVLTAGINVPRLLGAMPAPIDFRNFPYDSEGFATSQARFFLAHTAAGATAGIRIYYYPPIFQYGPDGGDASFSYQPEGLFVVDMTLTFSGGVVNDVCPILRQASVSGATPGNPNVSVDYSQANTRFYKPSSVVFNSVYGANVFKNLREATTAADDEVQTLTVGATSGQYKLVFNGQTSADIEFNANAATIETAFEALTTVGAGNGTVAGVGPFTITFTEDLSAQEQNMVTVVPGTTPFAGGTVTIARTTAGLGPEAIFQADTIKRGFIWFEPYVMSAGTRIIVAATQFQR